VHRKVVAGGEGLSFPFFLIFVSGGGPAKEGMKSPKQFCLSNYNIVNIVFGLVSLNNTMKPASLYKDDNYTF